MPEPQTDIDVVHVPKLSAAPLVPPFWLISDTHFFHKNIIKYAGRPDNHDRLMREAWHDDIHLGDIAFGKKEKLEELAPKLPGRKYLVLGNHDTRGKGFYKNLGFKIVQPFMMLYRGYVVSFTHEPMYGYTRYPKALNVHGHIHEKNMDNPRYINACVEQTNYQPVQITDLLDKRIDQL